MNVRYETSSCKKYLLLIPFVSVYMLNVRYETSSCKKYLLLIPFVSVYMSPRLFIIPNVFLLTCTVIDDLNTNIPISKFQ